MAGHGHGRGQGRGLGHESGSLDEAEPSVGPQDDPGGALPRGIDDPAPGHGRSEQSPGHRKQDAGARSARDFAPGRMRRA